MIDSVWSASTLGQDVCLTQATRGTSTFCNIRITMKQSLSFSLSHSLNPLQVSRGRLALMQARLSDMSALVKAGNFGRPLCGGKGLVSCF